MISIIVPTYEERDNIIKLVPDIHNVLNEYNYELILVDDNSPDGTADVAEELSNTYPIRVLKRNGKLGLASAILYGFQHAKGDILGVIDADLQHPPECMKEFVSMVDDGYDIVVGSRYVEGGKIDGLCRFRRIVSKGAVILAKPLTNVKDPMSGYFFIKRDVINNISFNPIGYKILLEILVKGSYDNVREIPYNFKVRKKGKSKLGKNEYVNYLKLLYHLYKFKSEMILNRKNRRLHNGKNEK